MSRLFKCFKKTKNPEDGFESSNGKLKLKNYTANQSSTKLTNGKSNHLQVTKNGNGSQSSTEVDQPTSSSGMICYESTHESAVGLRTRRDATNYSMNHPLRGRAVIFNFNTFNNTDIMATKLKSRKGSEKDVRDLTDCFQELSFIVNVFTDLNHKEFDTVLEKLKQDDHTLYDCLVVCVMTHGDKQHIYMSDGTMYPVSYVWEHFHADQCETLAGKPKLFFIQACRGDKYDDGSRIQGSRSARESDNRDVTDTGNFTYAIPNAADILVAFSSPLGHYSWRDVEDGSWFIQALCKVFNEKAYEMDIQTLLTFVAQDVALNRESDTKDKATSKKRQVTSMTSTLIRLLQFTPKPRMPVAVPSSSSSASVTDSVALELTIISTTNSSFNTISTDLPKLITSAQLTNIAEESRTETEQMQQEELDRIGSEV